MNKPARPPAWPYVPVSELDAEVLRAIKAANYGMGLKIPTDPITVTTLRASLHSGEFLMVPRNMAPDYEEREAERRKELESGR